MNEHEVIDFTVDVAKQAGEIVMNYFGQELNRKIKRNEGDYATEADYASERFIIEKIRQQFPNDSIVAEESGQHNSGNSKHTWIVDPLDGTHNFVSKKKDFGIMICRAKGSSINLAVAFNPARQIIATALKDNGTLLNGKKVDLSAVPGNNEGLLSANNELQNRLQPIGKSPTDVSAIGNALNTLSGKHIAHVTNAGFIWDFAVPALLLSEAGWIVTDLQGNDFKWDGHVTYGLPGIIAAPKELHSRLIEVIKG